MKKIILATLAIAPLLSAASESAKRLNAAADVFSEVMSRPIRAFPRTSGERPLHRHCPGAENRCLCIRGEVWQRISDLSQQEGNRLVSARHGAN